MVLIKRELPSMIRSFIGALLSCIFIIGMVACNDRASKFRKSDRYYEIVHKMDSVRGLFILNPSQAREFIAEIKSDVEKMNADSLTLVYLRLCGEYHTMMGENEKNFGYYDKALGMRVKGGERVQADIYTTIGDTRNYEGLFREALLAADSAEILLKKADLIEDETLTVYKIGLIRGLAYFSLHYYDSMQYHMDRALEVAKTLNNPENELFVYSYLAYFHNELRHYDLAHSYFEKALALSEKAENYDGIFCQLINLAENNLIKEDYQEAERCATAADEVNKAHFNSEDRELHARSIKGKVYFNLKKYDEAEKEAMRAYELSQKGKDKSRMSSVALTLSRIYAAKGNYDKAEAYAQFAYTLIDDQTDWRVKEDIYANLTDIYITSCDKSQAAYFLAKKNEATDSVFHSERMHAIQELEVKYQIVDKEHTIRQTALQLEAQKKLNKSIMVIGALLLIILALVYLYRHRRSQFVRILVKQNQKAEQLTEETFALKAKAVSTAEKGHISKEPESPPILVTRLLMKMEHDKRYLDSSLSLESLAEELGVHRSHLSEVINNDLKKSFTDFVSYYRIKEAKRILQETSMKVGEVCKKAGFGSPQTFYAVFKAYENLTPSEYRRAIKVLADSSKENLPQCEERG